MMTFVLEELISEVNKIEPFLTGVNLFGPDVEIKQKGVKQGDYLILKIFGLQKYEDKLLKELNENFYQCDPIGYQKYLNSAVSRINEIARSCFKEEISEQFETHLLSDSSVINANIGINNTKKDFDKKGIVENVNYYFAGNLFSLVKGLKDRNNTLGNISVEVKEEDAFIDDLDVSNDTQKLVLLKRLGVIDRLVETIPAANSGAVLMKLLKAVISPKKMNDNSLKAASYDLLKEDWINHFSSKTVDKVDRELQRILPQFVPKTNKKNK